MKVVIHTKCYLLNLSQEVWFLIANFFMTPEDQHQKKFKFSRDWRNFVNSNQRIFSVWKKATQIILLKNEYARLYMHSPSFRERINDSIDDPRNQLELEGISWENWQLFDGVRKIVGQYGNLDISSVLNVVEAKFIDCKFPELRFLSKVRKLTFLNYDCHQTHDVTCLRSLKELSLSRTEVVNYQFLGDIQKLTITHTESIDSVKCFRTVPVLNLSNCPNIKDISWLESCKDLTLNECLGITDVSALKKVPVLSLSGCANLVDVSALGKVYSLNLSNCAKLQDISALGDVHTLDLSYCPLVEDVSGLTNVHELRLCQFQGSDLSGLEKVVILDITDSDFVRDIMMLNHLEKLNITNCLNIHDFMGLYRLKELTAYHPLQIDSGVDSIQNLSVFNGHDAYYSMTCRGSEESFDKSFNYFLHSFKKLLSLTLSNTLPLEVIPTSFQYLRSLTLIHCNHFDFLPTLPNLGYLFVHNCSGAQFLQITSNELVKFPIYRVEFRNCAFLQEIIINRKVYQLIIVGCPLLKRIECNASVTFLTIDEFEGMELPEISGKSFVGCCINGKEKPTIEEIEQKGKMEEEKTVKEISKKEDEIVVAVEKGVEGKAEQKTAVENWHKDKENMGNVKKALHIHAEF
jgi:hypothetical protein